MTTHAIRHGSAVVIGSNDTALESARCLADGGVDVHIAHLERDGLALHTRRARKLDLSAHAGDEEEIAKALNAYADRLATPAVLIACGDLDAMMVARIRERLAPHYITWTNDPRAFEAIVSKDRLYARATELGIEVPPSIAAPSPEALAEWSRTHSAPYLVKPFYLGIGRTEHVGKNVVLESRDDLLDFVSRHGTSSLLVQRLIHGGDGSVFDAYGLCDRDGRIVTMASHRRIRQIPMNLGVTCYGEIPVTDGDIESEVFRNTRKLLAGVRYHGIFGIEWLRERATGSLYLVDFNARPFITVGHLKDCGLNLPLLAHRELRGEAIEGVEATPRLAHKYWVNPVGDAYTFRQMRRNGSLSTASWLAQLARCRSFAVFSWRDLAPAVAGGWRFARTSVVSAARRMRGA